MSGLGVICGQVFPPSSQAHHAAPNRPSRSRPVDKEVSMNNVTAVSAAQSAVLRSDAGGTATLRLNRPGQLNALSMEMLDALQDALDAVADDPSVRVVVIAANGKAFCPGHDLKEMLANRNREFVGALFDKCCQVMMS